MMQLTILSRGISLTDSVRNHVESRFGAALRHGLRRIRDVTVRLVDINGPSRGGRDKRCRVEVRLATGETLMIRETGDNVYAAITRAAERSKRRVLERLRRFKRRRGPGASRRG